MERRTLGKTGMNVSVLGFGGAEIGFDHASVENVERMLGSAIDEGLNVVDTASAYLESEELLGRALERRRNDIFLFTKCGATDGFARSDWSTEGILGQIERSLRLLRTDHVDLIQLHSCSAEILQKGDALEGIKRAREKGWARFIGYSGEGSDAVAAIESGEFDVFQTSVSIADQESIDLTIPKAVGRGMGVIAKRPVANVAWKWAEQPPNGYHFAYWERLRALRYDFLAGDLSSAVAKAIRFTLTIPGVHTAIVGTSSPGRWQENARAVALGPLPDVEMDAIFNRWSEVAKSTWNGQV
jgi:aryl-alcohol dehydrogenase-like predicted oxidoreductase